MRFYLSLLAAPLLLFSCQPKDKPSIVIVATEPAKIVATVPAEEHEDTALYLRRIPIWNVRGASTANVLELLGIKEPLTHNKTSSITKLSTQRQLWLASQCKEPLSENIADFSSLLHRGLQLKQPIECFYDLGNRNLYIIASKHMHAYVDTVSSHWRDLIRAGSYSSVQILQHPLTSTSTTPKAKPTLLVSHDYYTQPGAVHKLTSNYDSVNYVFEAEYKSGYYTTRVSSEEYQFTFKHKDTELSTSLSFNGSGEDQYFQLGRSIDGKSKYELIIQQKTPPEQAPLANFIPLTKPIPKADPNQPPFREKVTFEPDVKLQVSLIERDRKTSLEMCLFSKIVPLDDNSEQTALIDNELYTMTASKHLHYNPPVGICKMHLSGKFKGIQFSIQNHQLYFTNRSHKEVLLTTATKKYYLLFENL